MDFGDSIQINYEILCPTRHISKWGIPVTETFRSQNALCNGGQVRSANSPPTHMAGPL